MASSVPLHSNSAASHIGEVVAGPTPALVRAATEHRYRSFLSNVELNTWDKETIVSPNKAAVVTRGAQPLQVQLMLYHSKRLPPKEMGASHRTVTVAGVVETVTFRGAVGVPEARADNAEHI